MVFAFFSEGINGTVLIISHFRVMFEMINFSSLFLNILSDGFILYLFPTFSLHIVLSRHGHKQNT